MELRKFIATTIREYLNENSYVIKEEIVAYHRSPKKFNKFDTSSISTNPERRLSGWGIYTSNIIPNKEYGQWLYKVSLFKNKKEYVLLDLNDSVPENIVNKIVEEIKINGKKYDELIEFSYSGYLFYRTLSRILGGDKHASLFLYDNGIDGFKKTISRTWYDYILFNDNDITIEEIKYDPF